MTDTIGTRYSITHKFFCEPDKLNKTQHFSLPPKNLLHLNQSLTNTTTVLHSSSLNTEVHYPAKMSCLINVFYIINNTHTNN